MKLELTVNGQSQQVDVDPYKRLLDVLREDLGLTGTKEGCGEGECGACTVIVDGEVVNSCLIAVGQMTGHDVSTVEGLEGDAIGARVQRALVDLGGTQCGICTPGIALCATRVLSSEPHADRERIRELMAGNICRCTGYQLIVDAIAGCASETEGAK
ncbi:MAG: (2Fe-2S)-binding protein [Deltaproteobacteria bacterium]|nr:(2Fe-2S)-binding protein [Deltaproteobacteria bacterium]